MITSSLTPNQRIGNYVRNCKMAYFDFRISVLPRVRPTACVGTLYGSWWRVMYYLGRNSKSSRSGQKTNKNIWTAAQPSEESNCQTKYKNSLARKLSIRQAHTHTQKKQLNKQTGKRFSTQTIEFTGRQTFHIWVGGSYLPNWRRYYIK